MRTQPRAPRSYEEGLQEFVALARQIEENARAAHHVLCILRRQPRSRWLPLLRRHREAHTPEMLRRLASEAGDLEETSPLQALEILDVAAAFVSTFPDRFAAPAYGCLALALRRGSVLGNLGRHEEALAALRAARRFVHPRGPGYHDRADIFVERARIYLRTGRHERAVKLLHAAALIYSNLAQTTDRDRAIHLMRQAVLIERSA